MTMQIANTNSVEWTPLRLAAALLLLTLVAACSGGSSSSTDGGVSKNETTTSGTTGFGSTTGNTDMGDGTGGASGDAGSTTGFDDGATTGGTDTGGNEIGPVTVLQIPPNQRRPIFVNNAKVFTTLNPNENLLRCAQASTRAPCTLGELSMIGQEFSDPTVEDIMHRVVVTHDWAGLRFKQILERMPPSTLALFKPVTHIYIGSEKQDTTFFYSPGRLVINIDALWMNPEEKSAIPVAEDTGSGTTDGGTETLDSGMQFVVGARTLIGGEFAIASRSGSEREFDRLPFSLAFDLYWTLAYAHNFIRPDELRFADPSQTVGDLIDFDDANNIDKRLYADTRLTNDLSYLYDATDAIYDNAIVADDFLASVTAEDAGLAMESQGKIDLFSYRFTDADVASLFSRSMAKMHHDAFVDIAFLTRPLGCQESTGVPIGCIARKIRYGKYFGFVRRSG